MRKILTLLFSLVVLILQGQTIQYLDNNPVWRIQRSSGPCIAGGEYNYFLSGDTIIGSKQYSKVFSKGYMYGENGPLPQCPEYYYTFIDTVPNYFLRQDNKKLYCLYAGCTNEILLYDFDLIQNDTVKIYNSCDTTFFTIAIVDSVDSILIDTDYRKVLHLNYSNCGMGGPTLTIIEGIGCEHDLFIVCNDEFMGNSLTCYGLNGYSKYSPSGDTCDLEVPIGVFENFKTNTNIRIYPNPVKDKVNLSIPDKQKYIYQIELINLFGQCVLIRQNTNSFDVSNLSQGLYIMRIILSDSSMTIKKLIKN
jgi:hypothetical protein